MDGWMIREYDMSLFIWKKNQKFLKKERNFSIVLEFPNELLAYMYIRAYLGKNLYPHINSEIQMWINWRLKRSLSLIIPLHCPRALLPSQRWMRQGQLHHSSRVFLQPLFHGGHITKPLKAKRNRPEGSGYGWIPHLCIQEVHSQE